MAAETTATTSRARSMGRMAGILLHASLVFAFTAVCTG
jgi:hypothetical protein